MASAAIAIRVFVNRNAFAGYGAFTAARTGLPVGKSRIAAIKARAHRLDDAGTLAGIALGGQGELHRLDLTRHAVHRRDDVVEQAERVVGFRAIVIAVAVVVAIRVLCSNDSTPRRGACALSGRLLGLVRSKPQGSSVVVEEEVWKPELSG